MKTTRYLWMLLMTMMALSAGAQQRNALMVPDAAMPTGSRQLPVSIENTAEIAGIQFDIKLPDGVTAAPTAVLTDRCEGYSATVGLLSNGYYRVVAYSNDNHSIQGQSGVVMYLPVEIPDYFGDGTEYDLSISNAVLAKASGENVITETIAGKIQILSLPDLTVKDITCNMTDINPGEQIMVSWQVENIGEVPTGGGWSEQISLISEDGSISRLIATTYYDNELAAGGVVSRQAEITLPVFPGIDGQVRLQVRLVPDYDNDEPASAQGNNTAISGGSLSLGKMLKIELSPQRVDENNGARIALKVNRSGAWTAAQTFAITATTDSRVALPDAITIPAHQSGAVVYFTVTDNDVLDNDSIINISVSGNDYPETSASLIIDDDELPSLSVTASKEEVDEGETFTLTITTNRTSAEPIDIRLTCDNARRFSFPGQVSIPAGEASVTVEILAVDNDDIELEDCIAFRASANRYESGECLVTVNDNDMPTLTFTLTPESVSESDGHTALLGVIRRTDNIDKRITIKLSDDSDGLLTYPARSIVMEKNQSEARLSIGVADNDIVDGDHNVIVTAAVYVSSCDCSVPDDSKGFVTAAVTVLDDDGPTLKIKPEGTAMLEDSQGNVFTISHNTNSESDITVRISSDHDEMLVYDHQLTIPAGQTAGQLLIDVKSNDLPDDSTVASFKVEADGYTPGTCWLLITDQTLPDAVVSLSADKTEAEAGETVGLKVTVKNVGNSTLCSSVPVDITFTGKKGKVSLKTDVSINVGDSTVIKYDYTLPAITGNYSFAATVNGSQRVQELMYTNNSSENIGITLLSPFTATARADKEIYGQGEEVFITGVVNGNSGKNADVEVYLINDGARQAITAKSDSLGNYSASWKPLSYQSGHFSIGACYPGSNVAEEMDAFNIYGIKADDRFKTHELSLDETISGKIKIINPGNLPQSGLTLTPKKECADCEFAFDVPSAIGAGEYVEIGYTITANEISSGSDWMKMPVEVTTAEGSKLDYTIYYYVYPLKAKLESDTKSINTTMTYGTPREYPVTIRNVGKNETGKITLALPDWIQPVTPREMASLSQGDSTTIVLRFIPTEAMQLNVSVHGQIGINCANGDGIPVSFRLTPVSETKGTLKVDVTDEYTYFTDEAPHVGNAEVIIKNPSTGEIVAQGSTSHNGKFEVELPEGYYKMTVTADKHDSYDNTVIIDPGVDNDREVFLSYQAITYSWDVVETEVDDEYDIETVVTYETRVPKPVVIITLPDERPEPYSIIPAIVTNHGLVNALDLDFSLSVSSGYTLEFLNETSLDVLGPEQSYVFYAKLLPADSSSFENAPQKSVRSASDCFRLAANTDYGYNCEKFTNRENSQAKKQHGNCGGGGSGGVGIGSSDGWPVNSGDSGPGRPSDRNNHNVTDKTTQDNPGEPLVDCSGKTPDPGTNPNPDNNPGSGSNPRDPINLGVVPDKPVPESDCDEEPVLVFKLVPETGTRYKVRGVAADGVSKIRLVLDPEMSKLPNSECSSIEDIKWTLSKEIGKIDPVSEYEAIYTAPEIFDSNEAREDGYMINIDAVLNYTLVKNDGTTLHKSTEPVRIDIIKPLIVFLHGLGDSDDCWWAFNHRLIMEEGYLFNELVNYKETNTSSFATNVHHVADGIRNARRKALADGFIATKFDLIGHSMGGILARLYAQSGNHDDEINRIITLNTPHSGSEFGDLVVAHDKLGPLLAKGLYSALNQAPKDDIGAIYDLAVDSKAIYDLNHYSRKPEIPVFALATEPITKQMIDPLKVLHFFQGVKEGIGIDIIENTGQLELLIPVIIGRYLPHLFYDDMLQASPGDLIVSTESQLGGTVASKIVSSSFINPYPPIHIFTTKNTDVQDEIIKLLNDQKKTNYSTQWFSPKERHFNHYAWEAMALDFIPTISDYKTVLDFALLVKDVYGKPKIESTNPEENGEQGTSRHIDIKLVEVDGYTNPTTLVIMGANVIPYEDYEFSCPVPDTFEGEVNIVTFMEGEDGNIHYLGDKINIEGTVAVPETITASDIVLEAGESRECSVLCTWSNGAITKVKVDSVSLENKTIASYYDGNIYGVQSGFTNATISFRGLSADFVIRVFPKEDDSDDEDSNSVCSTITLSFKQKAVMTRQAFRGTLTVNNGNKTIPMTDVKLNLQVRDTDGNVTTSHEFQIDAEKLDGFKGEVDLGSGWSLGGGETGVATVLFIPTKYAAPTEPKEYSFGGTFSYTDPFTGLTVTRELNPVTLTVNPSPNLELTYFMQRDVFGDDPLTKDIEPMVPAEFALVVNNIGYGDAENLSLTTQQPQIIDNQKGLAINMEIISSQLNGGDANLALGGSVTSEFGTVPAHSQAYAQWWLQSSLLGHFTEYDVNATHLTSRDNPDLSLLDNVTIHELIRGFTVTDEGDKPLRGFLVNDIPDKDDMPDEVYFTDGTHQTVFTVDNARVTKISDTEYELTGIAGADGWNYGSLLDPTYGKQKLVKVMRRDGSEINADNFWQTDRTLRDNKDPLYEKRLHFVANLSAGENAFYLTFEPKPDVELEVESYAGVPENGSVLKEQLTEVTVIFNKPVREESFSTDDITLYCQGSAVDVSPIAISKMSETEYKLGLGEVTLADGFYVLTVNTSSILDADGFGGSTGKQTSWIQFVDGKVALKLTASPAEGGTISPNSGRFDYDSDVTVKATASEGYDFTGWMHGNTKVSTEEEYTHHLLEDTELTALFSIKHYNVTIEYDSFMGIVEGASSGIYEYGTLLDLAAIPYDGFKFDSWLINGVAGSDKEQCTITVDDDIYVEALFKDSSDGIGTISTDELNVRIRLSDSGDIMYITGNFDEILMFNIFNMRGTICVSAQNVDSDGISIENLNTGIYYVQVMTDRGVYSAKILKR